MVFVILVSLLLCPQLVKSQVEIIVFPNDVTTCRGGEARFSCFVQFTNGTPSAARWIQNGDADASTLPYHMLIDNSSSNSSLPAIVNNTLLITNVSNIEPGSNYRCEQDNIEMESDSASLTIKDTPTGSIALGTPTSGSASSNSIYLVLTYDNSEDADTITSISLSWSDSTGNSMGSVMLDASVGTYTIMGLTPSTSYTITVFATNQCGNGPVQVTEVSTNNGNMPRPTPTPTPTPTNNTSDSPGAAAAMKSNTVLMGLVGLLVANTIMMI